MRLQVRHGRQTIVERQNQADSPFAEPRSYDPLAFVFLDGRRAPELLLWTYTGGPHCCTMLEVFDFNTSPARTAMLYLGNADARLQWFGRRPRFVGADDRFAYKFTSYAGSVRPIRIWRYDAGRFADVTRRFPILIAEEERALRGFFADPGAGDYRGVAAAWAADEALLGHAAEARVELDKLAQHGKLNGLGAPEAPSGQAYVDALWRFLARTGYLRSAQ
jgi:hypothetical protein